MQVDFSQCGVGKHLTTQSLGGPSHDVSICPFLCCKCSHCSGLQASPAVDCEVTGIGVRKRCTVGSHKPL